MPPARPLRSAVAATPLLALLVACAEAPAPPTRVPLDDAVRIFLPEPVEGVGANRAESPWSDLHRRLVSGEQASELAEVARRRLEETPNDPAGTLLVAELRLVSGDYAGVVDTLERLPVDVRLRPGPSLVAARALELSGDPVAAYEAYRHAAADLAAAFDGAQRTEAAAARELVARIDAALARGRQRAAEADLERLREWRPADLETVRASARVAAASGDVERELEALRSLDEADALDGAGRRRHAQLELERGEPDLALRLHEELLRETPEDEALSQALERARFRWRLANAPEEVQLTARSPSLTRADLARLLYWLVPGVRAARGGTPRIASDVVGHPARDEVIRVVNLGLLRMNETLHRFEPDRPARRVEVLEAVLRAASPEQQGPRCAPGGALAAGGSWETICRAAAACGLIEEEASCLPGAETSGAEALEWIRLASREEADP